MSADRIVVGVLSIAGPDLKAERIRAGFTAAAVASVIAVTRQRVSMIEAQARVRPEVVARYLLALDELRRQAQERREALLSKPIEATR